MNKARFFCAILISLATTGVAAEQCKVLSDSEYTKLYANHTVSVQYSVNEDNHVELSQWDMFFQKNGVFSTTLYQYLDQIELMRFNFKGNWAIHNSVLSMHFSECSHITSQDPSENTNADEFCRLLNNVSLDPIKINPCNPFSWEGWGSHSVTY